MALQKITHNVLDKISNIKYGFYTRQGGVSKGLYESLNVVFGKGDGKENVIKNLSIIAEDLGLSTPEKLLTVCQVHSEKVAIVKKEDDLDQFHKQNYLELPNVDAIVTNLKGIAIGVKHADCGNTLLVDEKAQVIGAVHSGWKGALEGVLENTVKSMIELGANVENIKAVLGPCIRQVSYEVSKDFNEKFLSEDESNSRFFVPGEGKDKLMFDLPGYIKNKLRKSGVVYVYDVGLNTYSNEKEFFSYRRNTHRGENRENYGGQISVISLV